MKELVIATESGKGRSFRGTLLAHVEADPLWEGGRATTETIRPIWMMVACSDGDAGPFLANLRTGRRAELFGTTERKPPRYELLRSGGYSFSTQRHPEGVVITAYLPDLFRMDPGMVDPAGAKFVLLPWNQWAANQNVDARAAVAHARRAGFERPPAELRDLTATAALFAAFLDRRTRAPLIQDQRFYLQILVVALESGLASLGVPEETYRDCGWGQHRSIGFCEHDTERVGLLPGVAFNATHDELERFLAEQVDLFFRKAA